MSYLAIIDFLLTKSNQTNKKKKTFWSVNPEGYPIGLNVKSVTVRSV